MAKLTLLGTGNAAGMPVYGCHCKYCILAERDMSMVRTPCSALLEFDGHRYLIDAGQVNLHQRFPAGTLTGIILTHFHPDHVQGLFHLRWGKNLEIPVYSPPDPNGCSDLYKHPGILHFKHQAEFKSFSLGAVNITPLPMQHSLPTFGYYFEINNKRIAYLTDTKGLPQKTYDFFDKTDLDLCIIDCSFIPGHKSKGHNNLDDVLMIQSKLQSKQIVLTHIGHDLDVWLRERKQSLPETFTIAHDNLTFDL